MGIHSASDLGPGTTLSGDYFYNYFARGFDILFDGKVYGPDIILMFIVIFFKFRNITDINIYSSIGLFYYQTHKIKKFILHSNYPGHADFNSYLKCNFVICNSDCEYLSPKISIGVAI